VAKRTLLESILRTRALVELKALKAHPDFLGTDLGDLLEICNGCGAKDSKLPIPDTIWGLWIGPVCNLHDFRYHVGKTKQDKEMADIEMLANNMRAIEACSTWILKPLRRRRALTYYGVVTDLGDSAFWKGKERP
jgi:hypothetical protein